MNRHFVPGWSFVLLVALALLMPAPAVADCPNSPLRCIISDKGEVNTYSIEIGQCVDTWGSGCSVSNCDGDACGRMYDTCARSFQVSQDKVREANAYGKDCRR